MTRLDRLVCLGGQQMVPCHAVAVGMRIVGVVAC
jgi:hypothetical protein